MTNALAQNINVEKNAVIDLLSQAVNVSSLQQEDEAKFSNIVNDLNARFNKAQNNFEKQAKVTNTSSVNREALTKKGPKKEASTAQVNNISQNADKEIKQTTKKQETEIAEDNSVEKKEIADKVIKKESKEDLSDINNSSPVETSPVFSDKTEINEETKENLENALKEVENALNDFAQKIPVADKTLANENEDLKTKVEELFENIDDSQKAFKAIEEVTNYLNSSDLNQDLKNELAETLNELKESLNNIENLTEAETSFEEMFVQLKEKVSKLLDVAAPEIKENVDSKNTLNLGLSNATIDDDLQTITEQTKTTLNSKIDEQPLKEALNSVTELIKDVQNAIEANDTEKITQIAKELPRTIENLNSVLNESESVEIESNEKLPNALQNLNNTLENALNQNDVLTLEKFDLEKLDVSDKNSMNEFLNILENAKFDLDIHTQEEIKTQLEELIKKINSSSISNEQLIETVDELPKEIKNQIKLEVTKQNNAEAEISQNTFEETNLDDLFQNDSQEQSNFDFEQDVEIQKETKLKASTTKEFSTENIEQNLQKTVAIQEMLDEMMIEVDIKTIPTQSGALSVVDEITKLAIGETNTLNSIAPSGTVTYDSTGVGAVIKNVAQLAKSAQVQTPSEAPSMEDILNQVTNKITQLKDGATQKLTMVLRPNDLGRLQIELSSNQNGLTTQIMAQNEDVRAYIEKNIDSLRQQLADNGVNVNSIQIKTAGSDNSTTYNGNQNLAQEQEQNLNHQNNKENGEQKQQNNRQEKEILANMSNYDMTFAKDFSGVLNKTLNYSLN